MLIRVGVLLYQALISLAEEMNDKTSKMNVKEMNSMKKPSFIAFAFFFSFNFRGIEKGLECGESYPHGESSANQLNY